MVPDDFALGGIDR